MGKDIRLNSYEWCDFIFEGKNRKYGAYRLRESSSKRHIVAFIVVLIIVCIIALLPTLVSEMKKLASANSKMDDRYELSNIPVEQIPEQNQIKQQTAPPPPPLKSTIKFVPPTITKDEDVKDDDMKSQDDLTKNKITISVATIKGTDEKHGIDIAELNEHKVITQDANQKPFTSVEQMPTFPGGETELLKYIQNHVHYPVVAAESGIQGTVIVKFVVGKDGKISGVTILRGIDPSCDKEAVRVIKSLPAWIPGKQNGVNVPVYCVLPVTFRLQE